MVLLMESQAWAAAQGHLPHPASSFTSQAKAEMGSRPIRVSSLPPSRRMIPVHTDAGYDEVRSHLRSAKRSTSASIPAAWSTRHLERCTWLGPRSVSSRANVSAQTFCILNSYKLTVKANRTQGQSAKSLKNIEKQQKKQHKKAD